MDAVIESAKPPTAMENLRAGRQGKGWKGDKDKDYGQNSRTLGASINEAMISDHRTPEAARSQRLGNPNSPAGERTLIEL